MVFKKIDDSSASAVSSALNLFDTPSTNVTVSGSSLKEILPLNSVESYPFHFRVHAGADYVDLSRCYLLTEMCIRMENEDGELVAPPATSKVAPIQGIASTFIRNMRVMVNGRETFNANSLYAFKSYLETELFCSAEAKRSHMSAEGWFEHAKSQSSADDASYQARMALFSKGKSVQLVSYLHADLFQQPRYLVNNCELSIEIQPQTDNFMLMCLDAADTKKYRLVITACKLYVKSISLMDGLALSMAQMLEKSPARYALLKGELKSENISAKRLQYDSTLFSETIPRRIIVAFLPTANYEGTLSTSPFDFSNISIREISVSANGLSFPNVPYNLEWEDSSHYTRAYHDMTDALGLANSADSNGITLEKYRHGWTVFVFNTSSSQEPNDNSFDLLKSGTVTIHVKFSKPVPEGGIYMICFGQSDSLMMIDSSRVVSTDLTV